MPGIIQGGALPSYQWRAGVSPAYEVRWSEEYGTHRAPSFPERPKQARRPHAGPRRNGPLGDALDSRRRCPSTLKGS
jgi:hypothetical protein